MYGQRIVNGYTYLRAELKGTEQKPSPCGSHKSQQKREWAYMNKMKFYMLKYTNDRN